MNYLLLIILAFSGITAFASDLTPEQKGLWIAQQHDKQDLGFGDYIADMEMVLINAQGEESLRKLRTRTLEVEQNGESERRLLMFDQPLDVRGTVLLIASHKRKTDDQWLYFPAIKRVKKIAAKNKSGPFMGSEFSYEDFSSPEVRKYQYSFLREEGCQVYTCYVFARYPREADSGYSKQILWVDKGQFRLWKVEFYDRKATLIKVLDISGYRQYANKYWRAATMNMHNVQTQKKTRLNWSNYRFATGLTRSDFLPNRLDTIQ